MTDEDFAAYLAAKGLDQDPVLTRRLAEAAETVRRLRARVAELERLLEREQDYQAPDMAADAEVEDLRARISQLESEGSER